MKFTFDETITIYNSLINQKIHLEYIIKNASQNAGIAYLKCELRRVKKLLKILKPTI